MNNYIITIVNNKIHKMSNFFAEAVLGIMTIILLLLICAISCRIIDLIWLSLYKIFSPCFCPRRRREPWPLELCNCLIHICDCIADSCFICCFKFKRRLKRYKEKIDKKIKVKPIIYDDVHIIVVNPYDNYQIATVSKTIN